MTSQRAFRRILQLFRLLSTGLSQTLFHLVKHLLRLCPRFFTAKPSTALCDPSSIPPTGTRVSGESGHLSVIDAPIPAALASQNTSSVGLPQNPEPIPLNNSSSYEGASVSCPPMVETVAATTEPHTSGLAFATEVSESTPKPFGATDIDRYTGKPLISVNKGPPTIRAGERQYNDPKDPSRISSWRSCTHPEGALYFSDPVRRIFTDNDVRVTKNRNAIEKSVVQLIDLATSKGITFPDNNLELVLLMSKRDPATKEKQFYYYIVDMNKRLLFWLSDFDSPRLFQGLKGVKEPTHIKKALEIQYWCVISMKHCELYPYKRKLDIRVIYELRGLIIHANAESITSDTFLAPYEAAELSQMMDIINKIQDAAEEQDDHLVAVTAKFLGIFMYVQFLSFHGQPGARLDTDQSIYESPERRARTSTLLRIINFVFFGASYTYSEEIKRVWVDELVNLPRWRAFITTRIAEWTSFTIYSTVMLAVDVSFLTVPGVDPAMQAFQPVGVIAIYISVMCIIGSLFSSIILINQSRTSARSSSAEVSGHMIKMTSSSLGTDYLAIMYSVPLGLLMWGMIMFVAGFISVIFGSKYTPTLATAGSLLLISTIFVAWPVLWTGMQKLSKWIRGTVSTGKPIRRRRGRTKRTSPGDRQQTPPTSDDASGRRDDSLHSVSMA